MYAPKYHRNNNKEEQLGFIRKNSFGMLVSEVGNRPWATHIPFILNDERTKLTSHISRGNVQWKHFSPEKEVMVAFLGPDAYVSSSWYNHENVPTWNYMAVHVYGHLRIIEGGELKASLEQMMDHFEAGSDHPVSLDKMTPAYVEREVRGIVAFEITINQIDAVFKLSQNRDKEDYENIIAELNKKEDGKARKVAKEMKDRSPY